MSVKLVSSKLPHIYTKLDSVIFNRHFDKIANSYCLPVRMEHLASKWMDFNKILYLRIF